MTDDTRGEVDWGEVRERVLAARRALYEESRPSAERIRTTLRERARELARPVEVEHRAALELITFTLQGEQFAIATRAVAEISSVRELVALPGAPSPVRGLTAWRGGILPVLDLRAMLGLGDTGVDAQTLVVLGDDLAMFGVAVDRPGEVLRVDERLAPVPPTVTIDADLVLGVVNTTVLVLDADALRRRHAQPGNGDVSQ